MGCAGKVGNFKSCVVRENFIGKLAFEGELKEVRTKDGQTPSRRAFKQREAHGPRPWSGVGSGCRRPGEDVSLPRAERGQEGGRK